MAKFQLGSKGDRFSFIVPCFGFKDLAQAQAYESTAEHSRIPESITIGQSSYVPCREYYNLDTSDLANRMASRREPSKPIYDMFRSKDEPMPKGAYNVALVVEGPHQFWMSNRGRDVGNLSDCYAAWDVPGGMQVDRCIIRAARKGRGVVFARQAILDKNNVVCGLKTEIVFVEFTILDSKKDQDDLLRLQIFNRLARQYDMNAIAEMPSLDDLDDAWRSLVERAVNGFARHCKPISADMQYDIDQASDYKDQLAKFKADREFGAKVESFGRDGWQEALKLVSEPWQMLVVVKKISGQFSSMYNQTYCAQVEEMIKQHDCTNERKLELHELVSRCAAKYHARLWNYTGD